MTALKVILTVVFLIICVALMVIVLLQEGKSAGLTGSISGASETYWGKNKGRSAEGKLEKLTKYGVILFMVLALILNIL